MYYALPLKHERDRAMVGGDALILNVDPPHVYAFVRNRARLVAQIDERGILIVRTAWSGDRVGELVRIAVAKLRSDREFADRAAQFYAETTHRCARCHRRITDPKSVRRGLGPECAEKGGRAL